jgi:hypothetical protein
MLNHLQENSLRLNHPTTLYCPLYCPLYYTPGVEWFNVKPLYDPWIFFYFLFTVAVDRVGGSCYIGLATLGSPCKSLFLKRKIQVGVGINTILQKCTDSPKGSFFRIMGPVRSFFQPFYCSYRLFFGTNILSFITVV